MLNLFVSKRVQSNVHVPSQLLLVICSTLFTYAGSNGLKIEGMIKNRRIAVSEKLNAAILAENVVEKHADDV